MVDLSDNTNWSQIYNQIVIAQSIPNETNKHYPILPIIVPTILNSYTIAISSQPSNYKPTWDLGAKVYPIININGIGQAQVSKGYYVPINQICIVRMTNLQTQYRLSIHIPNWFKDVNLQVWVFKGEIIDSVEELLKDLENLLKNIENILVSPYFKSITSSLNLQTNFNNSKKLLSIITII